MGKLFDILKAHQINLGEFEVEYNNRQEVLRIINSLDEDEQDKEIKDFVEYLEINPLMVENLDNIEKQIFAICIYILERAGVLVYDTNDAHKKMTSNRRNVKGLEYKALQKQEDGEIDNEVAFRLISIIYQLVYREAINIRIDISSFGLVALISDPNEDGELVVINIDYNENQEVVQNNLNKLKITKLTYKEI